MKNKNLEAICTLDGRDGALYKIKTHPGWNLCTASYREKPDDELLEERKCPYQGKKLRHIPANRSVVKKGYYLPCLYRKKVRRPSQAYKIEE